MSKALAALLGVGVGVGAIILLASTSKAASKTSPPSPSLQFGQATTVQMPSGYIWAVAPVLNPGPVAAGVKVVAVFLMQDPSGNTPSSTQAGLPVITFAQQGDDKNSRSFLAGGSGPNVQAARTDFGV